MNLLEAERGSKADPQGPQEVPKSSRPRGCDSMGYGRGSQVAIPPGVVLPLEVSVNGVPQERGRDFEQVGPSLLFRRELEREGRLGPMGWLSMLLGIAGGYRQNDRVDFVHSSGGRRLVSHVSPRLEEER